MGAFIDETGKQYGFWTVLYLDKENKKPDKHWICKCKCGTIKSISGTELRRGRSTSCCCFQKKEWLNKKFGEWTVISEKSEKPNAVLCQCSCGEIRSVYKTHLTKGDSTSCGNPTKHKIITGEDLSGQKFGKLIVLERDWSDNSNGARWVCQCECGNKKSILGSHLRKHKIQSCGCINYSIGEKNISTLLENNNINFIKEYTPNDLERKLRFDFFIPATNSNKEYYIEFDGRQHYTSETSWSTTEEELKDLQNRDQIKNNYCLEHNIDLIRIPYNYRDKMVIDDLIPLTSKFLLKEVVNK